MENKAENERKEKSVFFTLPDSFIDRTIPSSCMTKYPAMVHKIQGMNWWSDLRLVHEQREIHLQSLSPPSEAWEFEGCVQYLSFLELQSFGQRPLMLFLESAGAALPVWELQLLILLSSTFYFPHLIRTQKSYFTTSWLVCQQLSIWNSKDNAMCACMRFLE